MIGRSDVAKSMTKTSVAKIAIVGATGLVGLEMRKVLAEHFAAEIARGALEPRLFASAARPAEKIYELAASANLLAECGTILNASTSEVAAQLREQLRPDQVLIDNSSAFRLEPEVPLVVPEVNGSLLGALPSVVANPNCTAILLCVALNALRDAGLLRVVVSTYQAASGAGIKGLEELDAQTQALGRGEPLPKAEVFVFPLVGNVMSHNTSIRAESLVGGGYNDEEWKVIEETRKILGIGHLAISATCVRVPVRRAHTEAVTVDLKQDWPLEKIREALAAAPGIKIVDDWARNHFPMPIEAQNQDLVWVGRIRKDAQLPKTLHFMLAGDQIRKGAATNAVQIFAALRAAASLTS